MTRLDFRWLSSALASLVLLLSAAAGCGKKADGATDDEAIPSHESPGSAKNGTDGGTKTSPGKQASKSDAGGSSSTTPAVGGTTTGTTTTMTPPNAGPAPKELAQLDNCGADNQAGLKQADIDKLKGGGDSTIAMLYPYDKTVFPRGLTAPMLMWQGASGAAVYIKIRSTYFAYDGCLKPTAAGQLQLPQDVWEKAGDQTLGPSTPFDVELSLLEGGKVHGPAKQQLIIAQATLKGSIYYNSYNSATGGAMQGGGGFFGGGGMATGSILRIKPGKPAEFFARQGVCTGCHTVSANGERMVAKDFSVGGGGGFGQPATADAEVYTLATDTPAQPTPTRATANGAFVGLSPDGKVYINTAVQQGVGPNVNGAIPVQGNIDSVMIETDTGTTVTGSGIPTTAMMPTFSPDATLVVFSDYAHAAGASLALMDYDEKARKLANLRTLFTSKEGLTGWPFLLPDNGAVVFTTNKSTAYSGEGVGINGGAIQKGPRSDLYIVDVETGKATILAKAMGYQLAEDASSDKTYLAFGAEELHQSYYPTVSSVAAGGYFWVFFDSVRHYGNQGLHRQLWGTAIAIQHGKGEFNSSDGLYGVDPSAPAFYVPGQELVSANHRAFTALDPCRADGATCETGIDCCSGFCTDGVCGPPRGCANDSEICEVDSDCCDSTNKCIGGYCGTVFL